MITIKKNNHFMHFIAILLSLFCPGCAIFQTEPKTALNPVLENKNFQNNLAPWTIELVAPASGCDPRRIEALDSLKEITINVPNNVMEPGFLYHANSDEARFQFLKEALLDPDQKTIIWTLRGGYGSARLIQYLKKMPKPKHEKIFIGFSDITALHLFFSQHWHWHTIHGSGLGELLYDKKDPKNLEKIADIIAQKTQTIKVQDLKPLNESAKKTRRISGNITGGNLTIVENSIGTEWQIDSRNKILFFEDVGEKGYALDRTLNHLTQAGILNRVKAIIFGEFSHSDEDLPFAIQRFATNTTIPVFKTHQFGHGKMNYPLIYNAPSEITPQGLITEPLNFELIMQLKK